MFLLEKCFVVTAVLLSVVSVKAQSENVPYCEDTVAYHSTPALLCYNYKTLPPILKNATEIRELWISGHLEILKNGALDATNLINLEALNLRFNGIKTIELGAFRGGTKIKYLFLWDNVIEEIDLRVFKDLPNLQQLFLDSNPLSFSTDAEFPKLNLTFLSLFRCSIHSIPPNLFKNLEKLEELNLFYNHLKTLEWKTFLPLKSLKQVHLKYNLLHCDCQVKFLLDFLDSKNVSWIYYGAPTCQSSSTPLNEILIDLRWDEIDFSRQLLVCPPEINSIHINNSSTNQTLNGMMISVECEYKGYPEPNVTWTKDDFPLSFRSGVTIETQRDDDAFPVFNYKFKQILTIPSSPGFNGSYKCHISPNPQFIQTTDKVNIPKENKNLETSWQLICFVLVLIVGLLLGVIITSGIYIAVRYSKVKRRQLPKKIYSITPRECKPNNVPQTEQNVEDQPYPPSVPSLGSQDNAYEICENAEVHFYEVPVVPPARLHPL